MFLGKTWGIGDTLVSSDTFIRHFNDVKSTREVGIESYSWKVRSVDGIPILNDANFRHSFTEDVGGANPRKKLKNEEQDRLSFKFSRIIRDFRKFILTHYFE